MQPRQLEYQRSRPDADFRASSLWEEVLRGSALQGSLSRSCALFTYYGKPVRERRIEASYFRCGLRSES